MPELVEIEARKWKGTPYHHKGRVINAGVDCGGLIYCVYSQFLALKPFPDNYPEDWAMHKESNEIYIEFITDYVREINSPSAGGLAMFQYGRAYSHGAICTKKKTFIHAYGRTGFGCVIESSLQFFRGRPVKFFALKD